MIKSQTNMKVNLQVLFANDLKLDKQKEAEKAKIDMKNYCNFSVEKLLYDNEGKPEDVRKSVDKLERNKYILPNYNESDL